MVGHTPDLVFSLVQMRHDLNMFGWLVALYHGQTTSLSKYKSQLPWISERVADPLFWIAKAFNGFRWFPESSEGGFPTIWWAVLSHAWSTCEIWRCLEHLVQLPSIASLQLPIPVSVSPTIQSKPGNWLWRKAKRMFIEIWYSIESWKSGWAALLPLSYIPVN